MLAFEGGDSAQAASLVAPVVFARQSLALPRVRGGPHPGFVNEAFANESVYNFQRERELKILTDPSIQQAIASQGIQLINFAEL